MVSSKSVHSRVFKYIYVYIFYFLNFLSNGIDRSTKAIGIGTRSYRASGSDNIFISSMGLHYANECTVGVPAGTGIVLEDTRPRVARGASRSCIAARNLPRDIKKIHSAVIAARDTTVTVYPRFVILPCGYHTGEQHCPIVRGVNS